ncbi:hypothetical protein Slin15195_G022160 [Septoria linicola]|uniref:Uncharacterized protein n=1 Tax=Septoria linicola TaxID=215465 RepID=A0A9Q9AMT7_9PEZI|nr:hypothetical protein Slin14017_G130630 [Septoria linicola]USW48897.1 hypothetical protein Slin15195_G022160 [Septoria linicola]
MFTRIQYIDHQNKLSSQGLTLKRTWSEDIVDSYDVAEVRRALWDSKADERWSSTVTKQFRDLEHSPAVEEPIEEAEIRAFIHSNDIPFDSPTIHFASQQRTRAICADLERVRHVYGFFEEGKNEERMEMIVNAHFAAGYQHHNLFASANAMIRRWNLVDTTTTVREEIQSVTAALGAFEDRHSWWFVGSMPGLGRLEGCVLET